jgi:transposase
MRNSRTRIKAAKNFTRNLKAHLDGVLAHCKHKISTSFLEGMNNKIKAIAFGCRDFESLMGAFPAACRDKKQSFSTRSYPVRLRRGC